MVAEKTYSIGEVAAIIGVTGKNSSTVRLWTDTFADWLSPLTRPDKGQLRLYTQGDARILMTVRDLRLQHVPYDEIRQRLATGSLSGGHEAPPEETEALQIDGRPIQVVSVDELQEVLSPVFQVAEALGRFLIEANAVGFQTERARLAASIEALNDRVGNLQDELRALRTANLANGPDPRAGDDRRDSGKTVVQAPSPALRTEPGWDQLTSAGGIALPSEPPQAPASRNAAPTHRVSKGDLALSVEGLNEYGLRPLPPRFSAHDLGSRYLCPQCGSSTRPLGLTPTARAVLSCIECRERVIVPLDKLEKTLGVSRGFWARLVGFLTRPFSRRRPKLDS